MAEALAYPLLVVRYEALVGSFLGETAARMGRLFEHARARRCVLFFDEFETLGKERGDQQESGEIKRVVSSLLLQIDALPSHVVVVTATNHPELLDRAVWRRFQLRLELGPPSSAQITAYLKRFEERTGEPLGRPLLASATRVLAGASFSDLEEFTTDVLRRRVLESPGTDLRPLFAERLGRLKGSTAEVLKRKGTVNARTTRTPAAPKRRSGED